MEASSKNTDGWLLRFTFRERVVHWTVALSFLYLALTGLALWTPKLFWLAAVFGGGEAVRWGHPWAGVIFVLALGAMFQNWSRDMRLDGDDKLWLRKAHLYAMHDKAGLPEPGRFNAGQKTLFWFQSAAAVVLLASGVILWFPEIMPRALRVAAILLHPAAAVASIAGVILHIYMATAATPGALRGMVEGSVPPRWAAAHHPKWYRENSRS
jgi:formate dehydrogenase subunit gamma